MIADDLLTGEGLGEGGELRGLVVPGCALEQQAVSLQQSEAVNEASEMGSERLARAAAKRGLSSIVM